MTEKEGTSFYALTALLDDQAALDHVFDRNITPVLSSSKPYIAEKVQDTTPESELQEYATSCIDNVFVSSYHQDCIRIMLARMSMPIRACLVPRFVNKCRLSR